MILASPYTQLFWNEYQKDKNRYDYNLVFDNFLSGCLDSERLSSCLDKLVNDYTLLNSHLSLDQGDLYWKHNDSIVSLININNNAKAITQFIDRPFHLDKEPLYRFGIVSVDKDKHRFIVVMHHALLDGNHFDQFVALLSEYYNNALPPKTDDNPSHLNDVHQKQHANVSHLKKSGSHNVWKSFLKGADARNNLPYIKSQSQGMGIIDFSIATTTISSLSSIFSSSAFNILLLSWGILVSKYCSTNTSCISYPIKIKTDHNSLFGSQINVNIAKVTYADDDTFKHVIACYHKILNTLITTNNKHTHLPIEEIFNSADIASLNVGFAQTNLKKSVFTFKNCQATTIEDNYVDIGGYDIVLEYQIIADNYCFRLKYNKGLFSIKQMTALTKHYHQLLQTFINTPEKPISKISLLTSSEYQKMVYDWNKTDQPYPNDKTIHQLFEEQVTKTPNNVAVVFEDQQLTYAQLNTKANQLARYLLLKTEIKPDTLIALFVDKSLEMIIAILGILKSGGAYVPIDPEYPKERIQYILEDTKTKQILTQSRFITKLSNLTDINLIAVDTDCYQEQEADNLPIQNTSTDLAYVIYTSGTTGKPKGVCCCHAGLNSLIETHKSTFCLNGENNVLQFSSLAFDASVWEIFGALLSGSPLYVISARCRRDAKYLEQYIFENQINIALLPPVSLSVLSANKLECLKLLVVGGDACNGQVINKWKSYRHFINAYGPTEVTVCATIHKYRTEDVSTNIGKPIHNVKCYVLDKNNQLVPIGVVGELYIAGAGLARGYLNQPKLTKERFINNPFASQEDIAKGYTRLYKTGDLCRYLPDGNIEYIGRNDFQVKVRGYRVELGEIEQALLSINNIQQAVVLAKDKGKDIQESKYLVGYFVTKNNIELNRDIILSELSKKLPNYMVPNALVQMDALPLTINGKLDRKALQEPQFVSTNYQPPSTNQEQIVCNAFSEVLGIETIGINDDFFKLGGNSITAIRLSVLLQQNFNIYLSEIFDLRTPQNIAKNRAIAPGALKARLVKLKETIKSTGAIDLHTQEKIKKYQQSVQQIKSQAFSLKPIKNVLLTGGAGFLGCNLLNQLLQLTPYTIYLLIRANNKQAVIERMEHKFQFYFEQSLIKNYSSRVVFIPSDLEKLYLGLSQSQYQSLALEIDSVIHAAALTKHYGDADKLRSANVDATVNLLKFTQLTQLKDFHYISTYSVFEVMHQDNDKQYVFTEDDCPTPSAQWAILYNQTKYLGEEHTLNYRTQGVHSNIYRVGNLACMQNGKLQEDAEANAFFNYLQFLSKLKCIPQVMDKVEISPTDKTAEAIIRLFDKKELINNTHHIFNPNKIHLYDLLKCQNYSISLVSFAEFVDKIVDYVECYKASDLVGRFLLRLNLNSNSIFNDFKVMVLQNKTEHVLKALNFKWSAINSSVLNTYKLCLH